MGYRIQRQSQGDGLQDSRLLSSPLPLPPQTGTTLITTPGSRGSASWETSDKIYCSALSNVSKGTLVQLIKCSVSRLSWLLAIESSRLVLLFTDSKAARNQTTDVSAKPEGDVIQVGETASSPCQQTQPGIKVKVPATREERGAKLKVRTVATEGPRPNGHSFYVVCVPACLDRC